jgi:hypothetical protein
MSVVQPGEPALSAALSALARARIRHVSRFGSLTADSNIFRKREANTTKIALHDPALFAGTAALILAINGHAVEIPPPVTEP